MLSNFKINLSNTESQLKLVKAMASSNRYKAYQAQATLADLIYPVINEVMNQSAVVSNLFKKISFSEDENPSIPLDLYYDINAEDYVKVYTTTVPGGLPSNQVLPTASELKFTTYRLDSAVSFDKKYASDCRLDVITKSFARIAQEILLKQELTSANLILGSLADATTNSNPHVKTQESSSLGFTLADFNSLITLAKRINTAWTTGTSGMEIKGVTDLLVSPETMEDLRAMAYNPVNTKSNNSTANNDIAAPEAYRSSVFTNGGVPELYGIGLMELHELGPNRKFCRLFEQFQGASAVSGKIPFNAGDDLIIGIDRSRESLVRATASDTQTGLDFILSVDDQYRSRQKKIGYYGSIEEGRMVIDNRVLTGIILNRSGINGNQYDINRSPTDTTVEFVNE
jgi:hypothetical protein